MTTPSTARSRAGPTWTSSSRRCSIRRWRRHAPWRRRDGRLRSQCGDGDPGSARMTDAVIIGAGSNELAAAHQLMRAGRRVVVVQERKDDGHADGWVPPQIAMLGLVVDQPDPWLRALLPDGGTLELSRDVARSAEAIRRLSPRDAEQWPHFCERMARLASLLADLYLAPPPSHRDLRFPFKVRRLGRTGMEDLMRVLAMPAAELLDDWFENDALKGALGALAVSDLQQGPRSARTAFLLLHFHVSHSSGGVRS